MTTTNVPSDQFEDLKRDVEDATRYSNSTSPYTNRVGQQIRPIPVQAQDIADNLAAAEQALANSGFIPKGDFTTGGTVEAKNEVFSDGTDYWRYDGALPFTVTAGSSPTPTGVDAWINVSDGTLRSQLATDDSAVVVGGVSAGDIAKRTDLARALSYPLGEIEDSELTAKKIVTKKIKAFAVGSAESSSLSADYNFSKLNGEGAISTTPSNNRAWLAPLTGGNYVDITMPFGVMIGDSIAEGHPNEHGRLHQSYGDPTFNDAVLNAYGTPAYALSQRTGMFWYNQGIGGQTTAQILERFERDGLGETVAVGDGRPDTTLPSKPVWVWVNAGINDVSALTDTNETKNNLVKMAMLAVKAGVRIGFNTIGPVNAHDATQRAMQDEINEFILTVMPLYGCHTFDFHEWFADPADATQINPLFDADGVHPNRVGYNNYVARLVSDPELPIYNNGFTIESYGETYSTNYRAPTLVEFELDSVSLGEFTMSNQFGYFNPPMSPLTSPTLRVYVRDGVDGVNASRHSGFSNIYFNIGYKSQKQQGISYDENLGGQIVKLGGTWQVNNQTQDSGIDAVSATATGVYVTFTNGVNRPTVSMSGSSTPSIYSATPQGVDNTQVRVRVFNPSTGAEVDPTTMPDNVGFNINASGRA